MKNLQKNIRELLRYPSAMAGVAIILLLIGISIYTMISIPYNEAIRLWRGGEEVWYHNPKRAAPEWVNWFRGKKLPKTIILSTANITDPTSGTYTSKDGSVTKTIALDETGTLITTITFAFDYPYQEFPQELALYFKSTFSEKQPYVAVTWVTPDGRKIRIGEFSVKAAETYRASQDAVLERRLGDFPPQKGLFMDPNEMEPVTYPGKYQLVIKGQVFEADSDLNAEMVLYGEVSGIAGTDHVRRNLMIPLLWGTPIALAFGLLAAFGTTLTTMVIAAFGVWFGGWVDELIQRITGVNMVLPFLPILIMVGTFYSRSIWIILGATILLSIFGSGILTYRAVFLQVKESPYVEAARAYGAKDMRIIFQYLTPRIIPMLIPQLVTLIPSYVFLEASLAVLGLGDPVLPTWGKIINDAQANGALYQGQYYWVLEPAALLMLTGLAFAMLGFSLDRIFNPRLRGL